MFWHELRRVTYNRRPLRVDQGVSASVQRWRLVNAHSKRVAKTRCGRQERNSLRNCVNGRLGLNNRHSQGGTRRIVSDLAQDRAAGGLGLRCFYSCLGAGEALRGFPHYHVASGADGRGLRYRSRRGTDEVARGPSGLLLFDRGPDDSSDTAHIGRS